MSNSILRQDFFRKTGAGLLALRLYSQAAVLPRQPSGRIPRSFTHVLISVAAKSSFRLNQRDPLRYSAPVEFFNCHDIRPEDFSTSYHRMWSLHPTYCENVSMKNLTIRSTGGNDHGIDVDSCKHVRRAAISRSATIAFH